jgi:hypothetical protein
MRRSSAGTGRLSHADASCRLSRIADPGRPVSTALSPWLRHPRPVARSIHHRGCPLAVVIDHATRSKPAKPDQAEIAKTHTLSPGDAAAATPLLPHDIVDPSMVTVVFQEVENIGC